MQPIASSFSTFVRSGLVLAGLAVLAMPATAQKPKFEKDKKQRPLVNTGLKLRPTGERPNVFFEFTKIDLGTFKEGETAQCRFPFRNTSKDLDPLLLRGFKASCTCSSAKIHVGDTVYELRDRPEKNTLYRLDNVDGTVQAVQVEAVEVPFGSSGHVDVSTDLHNVSGVKMASLALYTNEEKLPALTLDWTARAAQYFQMVPNEVHLNQVRWDEQRRFSVRITSPIKPDFKILSHEGAPEHVKLEYAPFDENGRKGWLVEGTFGPDVSTTAPGGVVRFLTDLDGREVDLRIIAWVTGPLEISPGAFLQFGRVSSKEGKTMTIDFTPNDGFDLQVEKLEVLEMSMPDEYFEISHRKDGNVLKVDVTIKPGAPRRLSHGKFAVHLNHPSTGVKQFQFNGFVR